MPCTSQGSRSDLSVGIQNDFYTPATVFNNVPYSSQSLNLTKDRVIGTDLQSDRQTRVDRHGNRQVGGDIVCDLRESDFDTLIESAMLSKFSTDQSTQVESVSIGTEPVWLSFQDIATDLNDQTRTFTGCSVSTMAISMAPNQMITTTFGIVGRDMFIGSNPQTPTASTSEIPFDSYSGSILIGNDEATLKTSSVVTSVDFTLTNSFGPTFTVGTDLTNCLEYGRAELEGTITTFFENANEINRFLNETESALEISVSEPGGGATYTFKMPRVKINSADGPVDGPGSRIITFSFVALKPATTDSNMFTIIREDPRPKDYELTGLDTSMSGSIDPVFSTDHRAYTISTTDTTCTVTPSVTTPGNSTIKVGFRGDPNPQTVPSGQASTSLTLELDINTPIEISVTEIATGETETYTLTVNRSALPPATISTLSNINIYDAESGFENDGLNPTPSYPQDTQDFTSTGASGVTQLKISLVPQDSNATMMFNGNVAESGVEYTVTYAVGAGAGNTFPFSCTAEDTTTTSNFNITMTGVA